MRNFCTKSLNINGGVSVKLFCLFVCLFVFEKCIILLSEILRILSSYPVTSFKVFSLLQSTQWIALHHFEIDFGSYQVSDVVVAVFNHSGSL